MYAFLNVEILYLFIKMVFQNVCSNLGSYYYITEHYQVLKPCKNQLKKAFYFHF